MAQGNDLLGRTGDPLRMVAGAIGDAVEALVNASTSVMFARAVDMFVERLDEKTGWGRVELKEMLLDCLLKAANDGGDDHTTVSRQ